MHEIETELRKITGTKSSIKSGDKSRQEYLKGLLDKIDKLDDADWRKLSEDAQDWVNTGLRVKKGKNIKDFEEDEPTEAEAYGEENEATEEETAEGEAEESEEPEESEEEEAPKRTRTGTKPQTTKQRARSSENEEESPPVSPKKKTIKSKARAVPPPASKAKSNGSKKEAAPEEKRRGGSTVAIKQVLLKNMTLDVPSIAEVLKKKGFVPSLQSITQVRNDFRATIRLLREMNWPKPSLGD